MMLIALFVLSVFSSTSLAHMEPPRVLIALMVDNNANSLPYSLFYLQHMDFPKSQISIWIHCSVSNDGSEEIVRRWVEREHDAYQQVLVFCDDENAERKPPPDAVTLRQVILSAALELHKDYVLFVGADNILEQPSVLLDMLAEQLPIIAPLLIDPDDLNKWRNEPRRPNFYTDDKERTKWIWERRVTGRYMVERVHGTVLIDLHDKHSTMVRFLQRKDGDLDVTSYPDGPGVYILNTHEYGFLPVIEPGDEALGKDFVSVIQDKQLQHFSYLGNLSRPELSTIGFDEVYVVNLVRRPDRKQRMERLLTLLGIKARFTEAVDGWTLTNETLKQLGVTYQQSFKDENGFFNITLGAVGCFLSHYNIWKHAKENNYSKVLIFEDDVRPRPHFVKKVQALVREADEVPGGWDMLYVYRDPTSRSKFPPQAEGTRWNKLSKPFVTENLAKPRYSYDTLAYILSGSGLEKVLSEDPLKNIIDVDAWIPILYGYTELPEEMVELHASRPRLRALATWPNLARPQRLYSEENNISDTANNHLQKNESGKKE